MRQTPRVAFPCSSTNLTVGKWISLRQLHLVHFLQKIAHSWRTERRRCWQKDAVRTYVFALVSRRIRVAQFLKCTFGERRQRRVSSEPTPNSVSPNYCKDLSFATKPQFAFAESFIPSHDRRTISTLSLLAKNGQKERGRDLLARRDTRIVLRINSLSSSFCYRSLAAGRAFIRLE